MVTLVCPRCGRLCSVDARLAGAWENCPGCGQVLVIPDLPVPCTQPAAARPALPLPDWLEDVRRAEEVSASVPPVAAEERGPAPAEGWYVAHGGAVLGPIARQQLRLFVARGYLDQSDLLWTPGMSRWVSADQVQGL